MGCEGVPGRTAERARKSFSRNSPRFSAIKRKECIYFYVQSKFTTTFEIFKLNV